MSDDEVRHRMSEISRRFPGEREAMRNAYKALAKREAKVQLAITFLQPELLYRQEAKAYLQKAKEEGTKMTVADKEALIMLELEAEKVAYDLAKFDCETSTKDFAQLEPQLSYLQSEMKLV